MKSNENRKKEETVMVGRESKEIESKQIIQKINKQKSDFWKRSKFAIVLARFNRDRRHKGPISRIQGGTSL